MSLKGDKYETAEETKFRLENTVVLYEGRPVYITNVGAVGQEDRKEIARVYFWELPLPLAGKDQRKDIRKYLSSRHFDLSPFKMGYLNDKGEATFVSRLPIRQQRQGLGQGNCTFSDVLGKPSKRMDFTSMISSPGFIEMVEGKYPTFKDAGELLGDKDTYSIAVSRSFAFVIDNDLEALYLSHKGVKCGLALKNDRALKVPPKFHFLREEMEECRIPLA